MVKQQRGKSIRTFPFVISVRLTGLEPAHRKTLDPKSSASTNFATDAFSVAHVRFSDFASAMYRTKQEMSVIEAGSLSL